jgi:endonuclease YncB( thermonuclease family)
VIRRQAIRRICGGLLGLSVAAYGADRKDWVRLDNCRWHPTRANDGDSFFVRHGKKTLKIRLYFCDAPETQADESWAKKRIAAQAKYWAIARESAVQLGRDAAEYVEKLLADEMFTVFTSYADAMGSGTPRVYALVQTADGKLLSEQLVEAGLARRYYRPPELRYDDRLPTGKTVRDVQRRLEQLEKEARHNRRGGWAKGE